VRVVLKRTVVGENYFHLDNHNIGTTDTPGFKPFTNVTFSFSLAQYTFSQAIRRVFNQLNQYMYQNKLRLTQGKQHLRDTKLVLRASLN